MCSRNIQNINSFINNQQQQLQQHHHQFNQFNQRNKTWLSPTSKLIISLCNLMNDDKNTMESNY
jgi:hypothetical protein